MDFSCHHLYSADSDTICKRCDRWLLFFRPWSITAHISSVTARECDLFLRRNARIPPRADQSNRPPEQSKLLHFDLLLLRWCASRLLLGSQERNGSRWATDRCWHSHNSSIQQLLMGASWNQLADDCWLGQRKTLYRAKETESEPRDSLHSWHLGNNWLRR